MNSTIILPGVGAGPFFVKARIYQSLEGFFMEIGQTMAAELPPMAPSITVLKI